MRLARSIARNGWLLAPLLAASPAGAATLAVPGEVATLQEAIDQAGAGDVVELAPGVYPAPDGDAQTQGFRILDKAGDFTIRAGSGGPVVLDGEHDRAVLRVQNSSVSSGGHVVFEGLTIRNGRSTVLGLSAGVTLQRARATFRDCTFEDNHTLDSATGGGGTQVAVGSVARFERSSWIGNTSPFFGGWLSVEDHASATVLDSLFEGNRVNLAGHVPTSSGGGIHVGNSTLVVERTRFEGNEAGYVGGALYALGLWDDAQGGAFVTVRNATFEGNRARPDPGAPPLGFPSEGGAVHAEDLTELRIEDSRFFANEAHDGAGVNAYRADVEIRNSVFRGNRATGGAQNGAKSLGGQISVISNDASDASTGFGALNRRPASLLVEDTLLEGRFGATTIAADVGGCLFAAGDANRVFGNGVPVQGTVADNRAQVELRRVVFHDCDVAQHAAPGSGVGGAMAGQLVRLTLADSLLLESDAVGLSPGDNSSGGALALLSHSWATVERTVFSANRAGAYGGAVFAQGAHLEIADSAFLGNEISPGEAEACWPFSRGAALFTAPFAGALEQDATGSVTGSVFSGNVGLPIFDDDRTDGPINDMRYDGNQFYAADFGGAVYTSVIPNPVPPFSVCITGAQMTGLVLNRNDGSSTAKTLIPNSDVGTPIATAALVAAPPGVLDAGPPADPPPTGLGFLGFAWSGGSATLGDEPLISPTGVAEVAPGPYELVVDGGAAQAQALLLPEAGGTGAAVVAFVALAMLRSGGARLTFPGGSGLSHRAVPGSVPGSPHR